MRFTLIPRSPKAAAIRSWVSGRPSVLPEILVAMAWASNEPIQIGRYRSASFSFRITRCWAVGMWMRMLSTDTSMRFFILGSILPFGPRHPSYLNAPTPLGVSLRTYVKSERGEGEKRAPDFDRRPQPHLSSFLRPAADEHVGRPGDQCRLRLHVDAGDRAGLASRIRGRRVRSRQTHVPLPGVRAVQSGKARDAGRPAAADRNGPRAPRGLFDPHLRRRGFRGRRRHRYARAHRRR